MASELVVYPWAWPTATVTEGDIQRVIARLESPSHIPPVETVPVGADRGSRWPVHFNVLGEERSLVRDGKEVQLLHPGMQRFIQSIADTDRDLLVTWTAEFRGRYKGILDRSTTQQRDVIKTVVWDYQLESEGTNDLLEATSSLQAAADTDKERYRLRSQERRYGRLFLDIGRFVRTLFTSGMALPLPVGLVLFEGRSHESLTRDAAGDVEGLIAQGRTTKRGRATSTSWHPYSAITFAKVKPFSGVEECKKSILMVHKIASPDVLAVDVLEIGIEQGFASHGQKEIMIQPHVRYHICKDDIAVFSTGDCKLDNADAHEDGIDIQDVSIVRLLYTHVFVEDECPLCNAMHE